MTANKNNDDLPLHAVVFAGPNGSGKSSLIKELEESGLTTIGGLYPVPAYVINPDQVAKDLPGTFPDQAARDRAAFDAAIKLRDEAIQSGKPFAYETVMSHPSRINEMLRLKEQGYSVLVTFITTDNPDTNVARVKQRVETGTTTGHGVPEKSIRERYERTLSLLPKAAEVADAVFVYDNSIDWQAPTTQAVIERDGRFAVKVDAKEWVKQRLVEPLRSRESDLETIQKVLTDKGQSGAMADELRGNYSGPVILATKNFVVQLDEGTKQPIIHDRLMLDVAPESNKGLAPTYAQHEKMTIRYTEANAPSIDRHEKARQAPAQEQKSPVGEKKRTDDRER